MHHYQNVICSFDHLQLKSFSDVAVKQTGVSTSLNSLYPSFSNLVVEDTEVLTILMPELYPNNSLRGVFCPLLFLTKRGAQFPRADRVCLSHLQCGDHLSLRFWYPNPPWILSILLMVRSGYGICSYSCCMSLFSWGMQPQLKACLILPQIYGIDLWLF